MNERIKELAEQAGVFEGDFAGAGLYSIHNKDEVEKFAELIVRECCFTGEQYADGLFDPKHYAFVNKKIKEHFGVE